MRGEGFMVLIIYTLSFYTGTKMANRDMGSKMATAQNVPKMGQIVMYYYGITGCITTLGIVHIIRLKLYNNVLTIPNFHWPHYIQQPGNKVFNNTRPRRHLQCQIS